MSAEELATQNHGLIYSFAIKNHVNLDDDDSYGVLAEAFWKACLSYDENKGAFSTHAYKYMLSAFCNYIRHLRMKVRFNQVGDDISMDAQVTESDNNLHNRMTDGNDLFDRASINFTISQIWDVATKKQRQYMELTYLGYSESEIARLLNKSRQAVNVVKEKLQSRVSDNGIMYEV